MQREGIIIQIREDGTRVVTRNLGDMADKSLMADKALKLVKGTLMGLTASITVDRVAAYADAWASAAGMVSVFTKSAQEQITVQNRLFDISQKNRMGMEESVKLYSRMAMAQDNLGASNSDLAKAVDAVGMSLVIQHTSASQVQGGLLQLGQAFGGARIQAQEFNSLIDQMPMLLVGIAKHIEGTDGTLNGLSRKVKDSTVTNKEFFDALMKAYPEMEASFKKAAFTIAQGFTVMNNATMKWVGENEKVMQMQRMWGEMSRWYAANANVILDTTSDMIGVLVAFGAAYATVQLALKGNAMLAAAGSWLQYNSAVARGTVITLDSSAALRAQAVHKAEVAAASLREAQTEQLVTAEKLRRVQAAVTSMEAERALEAVRLRAQITETGRIQSLTRMAEIERSMAAIKGQLVAAETAHQASLAKTTAMQNASAVAAEKAAAANSILTRTLGAMQAGLSMIGGPLGLIMLAALAWMTYKTNAALAREESIRIADAIDTTREALDKLTASQKEVTRAQLAESIRAQREEMSQFIGTNSMLLGVINRTAGTGRDMVDVFRETAMAAGKSSAQIDKGIVVIGQYESMRQKLLQTERQMEEVTLSQLNLLPQNYVLLDQGSQKLGTMEAQARAVATAFGNVAEKMAEVGRASGQLVMPQFSADMTKLLQQQENQLKLLNIKDPTARAGERAVLDAQMAGVLKTGDTAAEAIVRRNAEMIQSLQESERAMKGAGKEAKSLERQLRKVVSEFDPADGAALKYKHSVEILTKALAAGMITQEQFGKYTLLAKDHFEDLADPMRQVNRELEQQNKLLQMSAREREVEAQVMQITNDMRDKARFLTKAETDALREKLLVQQQLQELSSAKEGLTGGSMAEQARQFTTQIQAIKDLMGNGFGKSDAILSLQGGIFSGLFEGTDELLEAQIEKFNWMYERINELRQNDIISDQTAAMMRGRINNQLLEIQLQNHQAFYGDLATLANAENRKLAMVGKAAAITQATMDGYLAVQKALASAAPPYNYALATAVGIKTAANVAKIAGLGFETGGSFVVGGQGGADSQMVSFRATPGEKVTVATPNQVRKGDETSNGGSGSQNGDNMAPQIINVLDPALLDIYLNSPRGRKTMLNFIGADATQINGLLKEG